MLLDHGSGELSVNVVVVGDEVDIAHAGFLLDEDGGFCDFAEAGCVGVAGLQNHRVHMVKGIAGSIE